MWLRWEEEDWQNQPEAGFRIAYKSQGISGAEKHETGLKSHFTVGKSWGGGEPKLPLLQPRHSVWHLGVQSWTAVKSDRLSAPGEADKRSWMMAFSGRRKGIPIVKAKSRRHSYREIQKVLMCCVRKGGNLKCKSHPLVLGLPPALLYYLKMVA